MKVKKIKLALEEVKHVSKGAGNSETSKKEIEAAQDKNLSFEDIKEFRKAITPKRIELLHITRKMKPKSINELVRLLERDVKSVLTDIHLLENLGLIYLNRNTEGRKEVIPIVDYGMINLEIVV